MLMVNGPAWSAAASAPSRLSFAASTATSVRSAASSGSSRRSSSNGRNLYSPGSGAGPGRNIRLSLPSAVSVSWIASSEPSASPSGFSCVVTRKRSPLRIASTTAPRSAVVTLWFSRIWFGGELIDESRHPHAVLDRVIVFERQRRGPLQPQLARNLRLQDAVGRIEARHARHSLLLAPEHADEDHRLAEVGRRFDPGDRDEADPRILQLEQRLGEDLAERLVDSAHPLGHRTSVPSTRELLVVERHEFALEVAELPLA